MVKPRINSQITAPEVRVIDEHGKNLGVLPREQALALAKPDSGFDLIEIAPNAKPPVVRLMSFDKYRYLEEKAAKKERRALKTTGVKQVQISARAAENDLRIKVHQLEKFLEGGHPVDIQVRLRGREKGNKDWARQKLKDFLQLITIEYKVIGAPKFGGRGLLVSIERVKKQQPHAQKPPQAN